MGWTPGWQKNGVTPGGRFTNIVFRHLPFVIRQQLMRQQSTADIRTQITLRCQRHGFVPDCLVGRCDGVPLGHAVQRTDLCINSAYREALLNRNTVLLQAIVLAILVQMVGLALVLQLGIGGVQINVVPFFWLIIVPVFALTLLVSPGVHWVSPPGFCCLSAALVTWPLSI